MCGLIDYIFLTLYSGGKWAGNLQHPLRGYFIIMDPEKKFSEALYVYVPLYRGAVSRYGSREKFSEALYIYVPLYCGAVSGHGS